MTTSAGSRGIGTGSLRPGRAASPSATVPPASVVVIIEPGRSYTQTRFDSARAGNTAGADVVRTICNSGPSIMRSELDTLSGSVSRQLSNDRGECSSGIGADDNVGEAAHFPSPLDFLDGRLRVAGKHQQRVRRS